MFLKSEGKTIGCRNWREGIKYVPWRGQSLYTAFGNSETMVKIPLSLLNNSEKKKNWGGIPGEDTTAKLPQEGNRILSSLSVIC